MPNYAQVAEAPLKLTKKNELFIWGQEQQEALDQLKSLLTSEKVMAYPDSALPYRLYTDASNYALGAVLTQIQDGVERPIHYLSKTLNKGQRKWSPIEKECFAIITAITKLRPYLQGAQFIVFTDHKPLKSLFQCEVKNTKVQRWSMLLSEFPCTIEYTKGSDNIHADTLSRFNPSREPTEDLEEPVLNVDSIVLSEEEGREIEAPADFPFALARMFPEQEISSLQTIVASSDVGKEQQSEFPKEWAEAETEEGVDYLIEGGELYSLKLPFGGAIPYPRLMAPKRLQRSLIHEAHVELGHRGRFATLRRLQTLAVWPGMSASVKDYIAQCPHCQINARNFRPTVPQLTETPSRPFQRIGVDLTGPLMPSLQGNKYILSVVDHLTGWAEAFPIPNKKAETVWNKLREEFFPRYGFCEVMISDQGQEFSALQNREGWKQLGIDHRRSTPGHSATNGCVERFHRTIKETLKKVCNNQTSSWESHLADAMWGYRASETET
jgi:transposase InsO family protein